MRFEVCGKLDCPDWILAQLFHASCLNLTRFELICNSVRETILAAGELNQSWSDQLLLDEEFDIDDARACFAAINYIMSNACLYEVTSQTLMDELEQLGLPNEHSQVLSEVLKGANLEQLRESLAACEPH